jgi:hypothetical protein
MAKSKLHIVFLVGLGLLSAACTEEITLEMPEGRKRPVVEGSISNEYKRHEVILSYSTEMYDTEDPEMISGAEVYVNIGNDTIWFHEQDDKPGHYLSDSAAGKRNRWHHLEINVKENTLYSRPIRMYADTKMLNNATGIDSVGLLPLRNDEGLPFVDEKAAVCVCPYFQTLSDESIVYNVELYLNGKRFKNRPSKLLNLFSMKGYAGYYFNGPEMLQNNAEVPVGIMNKVYLHEGDVVKVKLYSISEDYMYFLIAQKLAVGVNPVMGAFPAMFSNLFSNCDAIGWFNATSVIEGEGVYHEAIFQEEE